MVIELKLADYLEMVRHARALAPIEDCGLLGGTVADGVKSVEKVYYLTNTDHSEEHFSLDPKEQFAAVKEMRANGWQLLGNWHSHPASPSRPSEEDKRVTQVIRDALDAVDVLLADHIIVADGDFVSLADDGILG